MTRQDAASGHRQLSLLRPPVSPPARVEGAWYLPVLAEVVGLHVPAVSPVPGLTEQTAVHQTNSRDGARGGILLGNTSAANPPSPPRPHPPSPWAPALALHLLLTTLIAIGSKAEPNSILCLPARYRHRRAFALNWPHAAEAMHALPPPGLQTQSAPGNAIVPEQRGRP